MNEMRIKKYCARGFTLLELVVAVTLFSVIFLSLFSLVANLQVSQKQIHVSNNFYDESRLLLERTVQFVRNNTIDYDRYYCEEDDVKNCPDGKIYEDEFYKDIGGKLRQLGGMSTDGGPDAQTLAFGNSKQAILYLIDESRKRRTALRVNNELLEVQTQIGVDSDNDGILDIWSDEPVFSDGNCSIKGTLLSDKKMCSMTHEWTPIAPDFIRVTDSFFSLYPNKDPYLAFADDAVQVQPLVRIALRVELDSEIADSYGFTDSNTPTMLFQTSAVSRIHGNTR